MAQRSTVMEPPPSRAAARGLTQLTNALHAQALTNRLDVCADFQDTACQSGLIIMKGRVL